MKLSRTIKKILICGGALVILGGISTGTANLATSAPINVSAKAKKSRVRKPRYHKNSERRNYKRKNIKRHKVSKRRNKKSRKINRKGSKKRNKSVWRLMVNLDRLPSKRHVNKHFYNLGRNLSHYLYKHDQNSKFSKINKDVNVKHLLSPSFQKGFLDEQNNIDEYLMNDTDSPDEHMPNSETSRFLNRGIILRYGNKTDKQALKDNDSGKFDESLPSQLSYADNQVGKYVDEV